MKREEIRVCILRVGGTNCDVETRRAFRESKMKAEIVHFNQLVRQNNLLDYYVMVVPGGFSHGDYVRAGAIWATRLMAKMRKNIERFVEEERPILGICNGFQVLVEAGLLPKFDGISLFPEAALGTNVPPGYNCRWTYLKHESRGRCVFTKRIASYSVMRIPVAHSEGRFMFAKEKEEASLDKLLDHDQLVFRYCHSNGEYADGQYPLNPNGSFYDIAGICDPSGTIFGLMPHPERAYFGWQLPDWTKAGALPAFADGKLMFDSVAEYLTKKF
ncbi:MAG: phosphoribosylformylglycinamidine synthase subunit PurQ [Candidatus Bathyarchaeia archaeon]